MTLQKKTLNTKLKVAIIQTGRRQKDVARSARMHEVRLSEMVHGKRLPTEQQLKSLRRVLACEDLGFDPQPLDAA